MRRILPTGRVVGPLAGAVRLLVRRPVPSPVTAPFGQMGRLRFVICGVEHSGTTLVSDLFRQVPTVDSGFETGVLLSPSPRAFLGEMPFAAHMLGAWSITQQELEACCETDDFAEFYARLAAVSRCIKPDCAVLFDKTPRYLAHLDTCMTRAAVPFVVTYKDPRSIVFSDFTRSGAADFDQWFDDYQEPKLGYLRLLYKNYKTIAVPSTRVFCVALERLCMKPRETCEALFAHCGQMFRLNYLVLKNLRYHHTRSGSIAPSIPLEYLDGLQDSQIRKIEKSFGDLGEWFYD